MAKCSACRKEMMDAATTSCTVSLVTYKDGKRLAPLKYTEFEDKTHRCHDCNVAPNGVHHPGCDMERCPRCHGQLLSCDCDVEGSIVELTAPKKPVGKR